MLALIRKYTYRGERRTGIRFLELRNSGAHRRPAR